MGLKDFWRGWHEEEGRRDINAISGLRKLGIHEQNDFEPIRNEVEKQFRINSISKAIEVNPDIAESFSKRDLGIRSSAEIYQSFDHQTNQDDINKAIAKLNVEQTQKENRAKEIVSNFAGASYYGYLKLRKWLDMPLEHPKLRPWYAQYLPQIPTLVNPGGEVKLLEGTFVIDNTITPKTNTALVGLGAASIIKLKDAHNVALNIIENADQVGGNNHIILKNFCIDANGANQTNADVIYRGIHLKKVTDLKISGIEIKNLQTAIVPSCSEHLRLEEEAKFIIIEKCIFCDTVITTGGADIRGTAIAISDHTGTYEHINIMNNIAKSISGEFIFTAAGYGINIINNHLYQVAVNAGYYGHDGIDLKQSYSVISGNFCQEVGESGIVIGGYTGAYDHFGDHNICANNVIYNCCKNPHDEFDGLIDYYSADYNLITDNVIRKGSTGTNHRYGINITHAACENNIILNNDLYDSGVTGPFADNGVNTIVKNNRGYNPVGISTIAVGASEFTHTAGSSPETIYIHSGTVSLIKKGTTTIFTDTGHSVELEPYELCKVTWSMQPTMYKDVH